MVIRYMAVVEEIRKSAIFEDILGNVSTARQKQYSAVECQRLGEKMFEEVIRHIAPEDPTQFVLIDIETGAWESDRDCGEARRRLFQRVPDAIVWMRRLASAQSYTYGKLGSSRPVIVK